MYTAEGTATPKFRTVLKEICFDQSNNYKKLEKAYIPWL